MGVLIKLERIERGFGKFHCLFKFLRPKFISDFSDTLTESQTEGEKQKQRKKLNKD